MKTIFLNHTMAPHIYLYTDIIHLSSLHIRVETLTSISLYTLEETLLPSVFTHVHLSWLKTTRWRLFVFRKRENTDVHQSSVHTARKHWRPSIFTSHSKETLTSIYLHFTQQGNTDLHLSSLHTARKHWPPSFFTSDSKEHWSPSVSTVVQTARNTEVHLSLL